MPGSHVALQVTDVYRRKMALMRDLAQRTAARNWPIINVDNLDATHAEWVARTAPSLTELQRGATRLSNAYLGAYVTRETRRRANPPVPTDDAVGVSRAGKPLVEALSSSLIAVKVAIGAGTALDAALALGLGDATRNANEDVAFTARDALSTAIGQSDQVIGWRRVTGGGCGACMAAADGVVMPDDMDIEIHDNCQCTAEPVVRDAPDVVQRPTGHDMFQAMTQDQQDKALGPDAAQLVRDGLPFRDLIDHSPMEAVSDQLTQAPVGALVHHA